jgi:RNA 2',3'-cyclic 3'-phosphodiesterase
MRSFFFALWPDVEIRARIAAAADAAAPASGSHRVPRENYHLTLAFVGEIEAPRVALLQQIGREQRAAGFTVALDAFEYWSESQVFVAVTRRQAPGGLIDLWTRLHEALSTLRRPPPHAALRAHVTLARKVVQAPVQQAMSPLLWRARNFCLVRSDTSGRRSVYTVVDTWPLLDEIPTA